MTRIVTPEEAQRLLDTPTSIPGSSDWDYVYINTYLANFLDAGPSLARTVVQQAAQIKRLQEQVDNTALVNEDGLKVRVGRVRKAMLDEGVHPPYHRRQVERLRQEWPMLYQAIMHLVKP